MICTVALAFPWVLAPSLRADDAKTPKVTFGFRSILPDNKKDQNNVSFEGITDPQLQAELKTLGDKEGYNSFKSLLSDSKDVDTGQTIEYRADNALDIFVKVNVTKVQVWVGADKKKTTFISYTYEVVNRTQKVVNGKKVVEEKSLLKVDTKVEAGKYRIVIVRSAYPPKGDNPAKDLIIAIKPEINP
jgi:hypothetical protein